MIPSKTSFNRRLFLKTLPLCIYGIGFGATQATRAVLPGIDVLERSAFRAIRGKRVGLLTHPAGVNRQGRSSIDVLRSARQVQLVALFGPEHGIYGDEKANIPVDDKIDPRTGLPVYSLYGKFRRPTRGMLDQIDVLVVDLQDIGARSYTYSSCMRYVIEECFKADKEVVVLDRPNPLGGIKTDGPPLEKQWMSYVGAYQVPYVHGLTIGELANMAKLEPDVLDIRDSLRIRGRLRIIPMEGWRRSMMWPQTGLKWVPTSPAIPDLSAVLGYPMTGLGAQLGSFSHGYGTHLPFRLLQYTGAPPEKIAASLTERQIPGLAFPVVPFSVGGQPRRATYVEVTNWSALQPTELSLHMMALACQWSPTNPFAAANDSAKGLFNKHVGDSRVLQALIDKGAQIPIRRFIDDWRRYNAEYRQRSQKWHLYK